MSFNVHVEQKPHKRVHFIGADREPGTARLSIVWGKLELAAERGWRRSKGCDMGELMVTGCCQAALKELKRGSHSGLDSAGPSKKKQKTFLVFFSVGDHWKHDGRQLGVTAEKTVRERL